MQLRVGTILAERYELLEKIGEGGFGVVFRAFDKNLDRQVAIKVVKDARLPDIDLGRFQREAKLLAQLRHKNIIAVYSMEQVPGSMLPYIVMEFLEGKSLRDILNVEAKLDSDSTIALTKQICAGLSYAQSLGIVHRDLSTANVFVRGFGTKDMTVKLIDFGLSRICGADLAPMKTLTETGMIVGNPAYMSPEVIRGEVADARSDIYALGCIIYECISGKQAFAADNQMGLLYSHQSQYPEQPQFNHEDTKKELLAALALRCIQKDPSKRFQNTEEISMLLETNHSATAVLARGMDSWDKQGYIRAKTKLGWRSVAVFVIIAFLSFPIFSEPILCKVLAALTSISILPVQSQRALADFLKNNHRKEAAKQLYEHLDSLCLKNDDTFNLSYCRVAEAEIYLSKAQRDEFFLAADKALESLIASTGGKDMDALILRFWSLLGDGDKTFGVSARSIILQCKLFELMIDSSGTEKSTLKRGFNRILSYVVPNTASFDETAEQIQKTVALYLPKVRYEFYSTESDALNHLCSMPLRDTRALWRARLKATKYSKEDRDEMKIVYGRTIIATHPDEAFHLALEVRNDASDPHLKARAYLLDAYVFMARNNFKASLKSCNEGLEVLSTDRGSVHYFKILPIKIRSLYHLHEFDEMQSCSMEMQNWLWEPEAEARVSTEAPKQYLKRYLPPMLDSISVDGEFLQKWYDCVSCLIDTKQWKLANLQFEGLLELRKRKPLNLHETYIAYLKNINNSIPTDSQVLVTRIVNSK